LTWISALLLARRSVALLSRWRSTVLRLLSVAALVGRWPLPILGRLIAILRWLTSVLRLLTVTLVGWRTAVAALWRTAGRHMRLLVLGVVAGIDGAEDELDHPEVRSEIDGWDSSSHLGGLILVV
jgi:hypothetical protein